MSTQKTRFGLKYRKMVTLAMFAAIVVVLQIISTFIRFGPFSITLALVPLVIVGALYGVAAGTFMGAVLSVTILIMTFLDGSTAFMLSINPIATIAIILLKTTVAGTLAALAYRLLAKKSDLAATILAGIVCPVVNTAIYIIGMLLFFTDSVFQGAANEGMEVFAYIFIGMSGLNFLVELGVNLVLSVGIVQIIRVLSKRAS